MLTNYAVQQSFNVISRNRYFDMADSKSVDRFSSSPQDFEMLCTVCKVHAVKPKFLYL